LHAKVEYLADPKGADVEKTAKGGFGAQLFLAKVGTGKAILEFHKNQNGDELRISTATAMENCVITAITKNAMVAALREDDSFSRLFMAHLLTRNRRIEEDLIDQLINSSERRLARMLLVLANFGKEGSPQPISPHISQETLADLIGTTRSRVSYFMNKFRKLGFIRYNGNIEVNGSLLSAALHEDPRLKKER
jgi:CRP/FNR family cyclic AMP-dependent transcriptional regulator